MTRWYLPLCMSSAIGCAWLGTSTPPVQGAPHMTFVFHGRPLCAVFLDSANNNPLDDEVHMLVTPGECAETIVDTGMPGTEPRP